MKLPRDLSGREFARVLCDSWDYRQVHQAGSHLILDTETPFHQRISIPDHHPLRLGTLNSILRLVAAHKGVDKREVLGAG